MKLVGKELISHAFFRLLTLFFCKINFFEKFFRGYHQVVKKILDPDQSRRNVGPDLAPSCLQRLSADYTSRQRVTGDGIYKLVNFSCFVFRLLIYFYKINFFKKFF